MTLRIPLVHRWSALERIRVRLMVSPVLSPLGLLDSVMALGILLVDRLMSVSVRRWRETTCVVRWSARTFVRHVAPGWSARTFVRHVAPAADASLTSRSISYSAFFVAFFLSRF